MTLGPDQRPDLGAPLSRRRLLGGALAGTVLASLDAGGLLRPLAAAAGTDTYPYPNGDPASSDPWGFTVRQCTSYVAWKINETGTAFSNRMNGGYFGNAKNWDDNAARLGWTVSSVPRPKSIGVLNSGDLGHVAFVESVNPDGSVNVSEYNWNFNLRYNERSNVRFDAYIYVPAVTGLGDLTFVKTRNAGSGLIELHTATAASGYQSGLSTVTRFGAAEGGNGTFTVLPDRSIGFVKTKNVGSNKIEVHFANASQNWANGYGAFTRFGLGDAGNGQFSVLPNRAVAFLKTRNTGSGKVELHTASASSGYTKGVSTVTRFSLADVPNGWFGVLPDRTVYFVKTKSTGSKLIELHTATPESSYRSGVSTITRFGPADGGNGVFGHLADGTVYFVKTRNTSSLHVELHTATASTGYRNGISTLTRFATYDADNGPFRLLP